MPDVTVIIPTFNEEENLPAALDSVRGWAREVFIVDSLSTDRTVDIALSRRDQGVRVVQHPFESYAAQWNWALERLPISSAWTLKLDADERLTPAFRDEVESLLRQAPAELEGVFFRRRMIFMGKPLKWGGFSSTYVLHLWRSGKAVFEQRPVNEHVLLQGPTRKIDAFIDHHDHKDLSEWIAKHNRYSSMEASLATTGNLTGEVAPHFLDGPTERRMFLKKLHGRLPGRHLLYFLYLYVVRLGWLDGLPGFRLAFLRTAYFYWIDLKVVEHQATGKLPSVEWPRRGLPHSRIVNSKLQSQVEQC
jgi:glycosyltransferase involved in cell wall biosynthesis